MPVPFVNGGFVFLRMRIRLPNSDMMRIFVGHGFITFVTAKPALKKDTPGMSIFF
jgi:hypothetical protein